MKTNKYSVFCTVCWLEFRIKWVGAERIKDHIVLDNHEKNSEKAEDTSDIATAFKEQMSKDDEDTFFQNIL